MSAPALVAILGLSFFLAAMLKWLLEFIPKKVRPPFSVVLYLLGVIFRAIDSAGTYRCVAELEHNHDLEAEEIREKEAEGGIELAPEVNFYGMGCFLGPGTDVLAHVSPEVILLFLLPPVIYYSTMEVNWHTLKRTLAQSLLLAFPGVGVSMLILGLYNHTALIGIEWNWPQSFLLGSILAATDPVAVVAALKELGAPEKLTTIIEGESLLNDGSAFVMFLIFKGIANGTDHRPVGALFGQFFQLALGGPLWGISMGIVAYLWHRLVYNNLIVEIAISAVGAFMVFWLADEILNVSSLLALVSFGFFYAYRAKYALSPESEHTVMEFWGAFAWFAETMIFIIAGVISYDAIIDTEIASNAVNWVNLLIMFLVMNIARFLMVWAFMPLLTQLGGSLTFKESIIVGWGGLRGAVSLTLAVIVTLDVDDVQFRTFVLFFVAGCVALTLLVNGMTTEVIYNALKMVAPSSAAVTLYSHALSVLDEDMQIAVSRLENNWFYKTAMWTRIHYVIPKFSRVTFRGPKVVFGFPSVQWLFHGVPLQVKRAEEQRRARAANQGNQFQMSMEQAAPMPAKKGGKRASLLPSFFRNSVIFGGNDNGHNQVAPPPHHQPSQQSHLHPNAPPGKSDHWPQPTVGHGANTPPQFARSHMPNEPARRSLDSERTGEYMRRPYNPDLGRGMRNTLIHVEGDDNLEGGMINGDGDGGYLDIPAVPQIPQAELQAMAKSNRYTRTQSGLFDYGDSYSQVQPIKGSGGGPKDSPRHLSPTDGSGQPMRPPAPGGGGMRPRSILRQSVFMGGAGVTPDAAPGSSLPSLFADANHERYMVFLNAVKARYHKQFLAGFLHDRAMAVLETAVHAVMDPERVLETKRSKTGGGAGVSLPRRMATLFNPAAGGTQGTDAHVDFTDPNKLNVEFEVILQSLKIPQWVLNAQSWPVFGIFARLYVYEQLHVTCEALIGYINAHHAIIQECTEHPDELELVAGLGTFRNEVVRNVNRARGYIQQLYREHTDAIESIQTILAASILLRLQRDKVRHLAEEGVLDVAAGEELAAGCDDMLASLKDFYRPIVKGGDQPPTMHPQAAPAYQQPPPMGYQPGYSQQMAPLPPAHMGHGPQINVTSPNSPPPI